MKKSILLLVLVAFVGVAYASTLALPWFKDDPAGGGNEDRGFCTLVNVTDEDILFAIYYTEVDVNTLAPVDATPSPNTFLLPAGSAVAFRPVQNSPAGEGAGQYVPNKVVDATRTSKAGSALIKYVGAPGDIVGRYASVNYNNGTRGAQFAYLMPGAVGGGG